MSSDELPSWTSRTFCRYNTQSEPEEVSYCTSDSSSDPECLRCCTDYYPRASGDQESIWSGDSETEHQQQLQDWKGELAEGFRLVFFIALPMLARQIGSLFSRRILTRIFGRISA